jgi:hypothetical protein
MAMWVQGNATSAPVIEVHEHELFSEKTGLHGGEAREMGAMTVGEPAPTIGCVPLRLLTRWGWSRIAESQ